MSIGLNPERTLRSLPVEHDGPRSNDETDAPNFSLGPVQRLALDSDRLENRDLSMLLALAIAEGTRELAKMRRDTARVLTEGQIAILASMIRLEPAVAAFLEDTRFAKTMAMAAVNLGMAAAPAVKGGAKKLDEKLGKKGGREDPKSFGLKAVVASVFARPSIATRLGRFRGLQDQLILKNPRARYLFARNAATAELGERLRHRPDLREGWLKVKTQQHAKRLLSEAKARRPSLDLADWKLDRSEAAWRSERAEILAAQGLDPKRLAAQLDREQMLRDVFGANPTKRQVQLLDEAVQLLASGGEPFHSGLIRRTGLMSREALAKKFERHRPFYGRAGDAAERQRIAAAIRERRVDLSLPLRDADGHAPLPERVGMSSTSGTAGREIETLWDDGWSKDEQESPDGLNGIADVERQILDAWYSELMSARLDTIRWAGRFGDLFADVADITIGMSDD